MSQRNVCYIVCYHDTEPKSISDMVLRAPRRKQFHYCTKWCRCAEVLFHPAVLSEIARDVKEKRLLHRFFHRDTEPTSNPDMVLRAPRRNVFTVGGKSLHAELAAEKEIVRDVTEKRLLH